MRKMNLADTKEQMVAPAASDLSPSQTSFLGSLVGLGVEYSAEKLNQTL